MDRYIGIDAHTQSCTLAVMGPSGKRLKEVRLETNGKVITEFTRSLAGHKHICLEEGTQAEWLYEMLEPLAEEVVVQLPERELLPMYSLLCRSAGLRPDRSSNSLSGPAACRAAR